MIDFNKKNDTARYMYPEDISNYPKMAIEVVTGDYPTSVFLPIPIGMPIQDGMSYGSNNLNQIGAIAQDVLNSGGSINSIGNSISKMKNELAASNDSTTNTAALAMIAQKNGMGALAGGDTGKAIAEAVLYNKRTLLNPNQVTTFNGSNTRSYSFEFKLIATSQKDSDTIRNILERLRLNAYPSGNRFTLKYPSEFNIKVLNRDDTVNKYYSPTYNCFLLSMSSSYNTTANSFYKDGAPLDVTLSLQFQETKALTREDIEKMHSDRSSMPDNFYI